MLIGIDELLGKVLELQRKVLLQGLSMLADLVLTLPMPEARGSLLEHLRSTLAAIEADTLPAAARHYLAFLAVLKKVAPHAQTRAVRDVAQSVAGLMVEYGEGYYSPRELDANDG